MTKPQIVLVPGAWHTPQCFDLITEKLEAHGYSVHSVHMPAVGRDDSPPPDLEEDYAALRQVVKEAIGEGNDVVVVPHSWAGIPVTGGLSGFSKERRKEQSLTGGVVKTAHISTFIIQEGTSMADLVTDKSEQPDWWAIEVGHFSF